MKNLKRVLRWTTGSLTAVILAVIAVLIFGDLSAFRERAQGAASEVLGMPVTIAGEMSLRPSLPPVITLNDVQIGNPEWAFHDNYLRANQVFLTLSIRSLLAGKINITAVELSAFELIVEHGPDGIYNAGIPNWGANSNTDDPQIESITLRGGILRWVDHRRGPFPEVHIDRLESTLEATQSDLQADISIRDQTVRVSAQSGPIRPLVDEEGPLQVRGKVVGKGWSLTLSGDIDADLTSRLELTFDADVLSVLNEFHGLALPPLGPARINTTLSASTRSLLFSDLRIEVSGNRFSGESEITLDTPVVAVHAEMSTDDLQLANIWRYQRESAHPDSVDFLDYKIPLAELALGGIDTDLTITAESIHYQHTALGSARVHITSSDGTGSVNADASILGGDYHALTSVSTKDHTPFFHSREKRTTSTSTHSLPKLLCYPSVVTK